MAVTLMKESIRLRALCVGHCSDSLVSEWLTEGLNLIFPPSSFSTGVRDGGKRRREGVTVAVTTEREYYQQFCVACCHTALYLLLILFYSLFTIIYFISSVTHFFSKSYTEVPVSASNGHVHRKVTFPFLWHSNHMFVTLLSGHRFPFTREVKPSCRKAQHWPVGKTVIDIKSPCIYIAAEGR